MQDADNMQAKSLLNVTQLEDIYQQYHVSREKRGYEPLPPHVSAEALSYNFGKI